MVTTSRKIWAFITSVVLALSGVVGITAAVTPAKALTGSMFDPGLIIGDSVFYDFGSMSADDIQTFLNQQVGNCKLAPAVNAGDFTCLRYYKTDIPAMAADPGRCTAIAATTDVRASDMIAIISKACNINPRVILVTLQKEQGLVTSTNPYWPDSSNPSKPSTSKPQDYRYQIAMGFNCPDTSPCTTFGFFYQVYKAASQFHWYGNPAGSFTYLKVGQNVSVNYQVPQVSGCGSRTFLLKSQATAALYYYTPYTPNDAALNNLYGSGDRCSAYGNRNFWRYYWDWFGSPIGGGFLIKAPTSDTYLIVPNSTGGFNKYDIQSQALVTALEPLGPVGTVSQAYLDTFPTAGNAQRIVKSATNQYYFVDNGAKYSFSSCAQAASFGLNCSDAVQLTAYQLNALATGSAMSALVPDNSIKPTGAQYLITNGVIHEILDTASVRDAGLTLPAVGPVGIAAFSYLKWGAPIAKQGLLFTNRTTGNKAVIVGGKYFEIDPGTSSDMDFKTWFPWSAGTLSAAGVDAIRADSTVQTIDTDEGGTSYILTPNGRLPVAAGSLLTQSASSIPAALLKLIPLSSETPVASPLLAKATSGKIVYWLDQGIRRPVASATDQVKLSGLASTLQVRTLPKSAIEQIDLGDTVLAPARLLSLPTGQLVYTDGFADYLSVPNQTWAAEYGIPTKSVGKITKADLSGYTDEGAIGLKILCDGVQHLVAGGTWQPVNDDYASHYPGIAQVVDPLTCKAMKFGNHQVGRIVTTAANTYYLMVDGKRRLMSVKQYGLIRGTTPEAVKIDATVASAIPVGPPLAANYKTVLINPEDAVVPTPAPSVTPSVTPTPTQAPTKSATPAPTPSPTKSVTTTPTPTKSATPPATPTPTPTKAASPTPSPTPKPTKSPAPVASATPSVRYYTVVSGDTLNKIATRFGVSANAIRVANGMTNDIVKLGLKLIIPSK